MLDFVPADNRVGIKEREKIDKYQDLARELEKLWYIKVKLVVFVVGAFGTAPKDLERRLEQFEIRSRFETIQIAECLYTSRRLEKTCCHSDVNEKLRVKISEKPGNWSSNLGQTTRTSDCQWKKMITCWTMDFAVSPDHWVKEKEREKIDKYLNPARELKKKPHKT